MNYIIVPTSNSDYQSWQCRLLNWSRKKVKQEGKLIFLRCADEMGVNRPLDVYTDRDVEVIDLPDYGLEWELQHEEALRGQKYWWGAIPNKYKSIEWFCNNYPLKDDDSLLFLDPDMIFLEAVDYVPEENEVITQRFIDYVPLQNWVAIPDDKPGFGVMYPFSLKASTLKKLIGDYVNSCEQIRVETHRWESEMWGLDYAVKKNNLSIRYEDDFGRCAIWQTRETQDKFATSKMVHFPNQVLDKDGNELFFKQNYTFFPTMSLSIDAATTTLEKKLIQNVSQERTDYFYYLKWDSTELLKKYSGTEGYIIFKPWPGGFNNIRMSLELAACVAYLTNKTLVLPPKYQMYLLKDQFGMEDFFDVTDMGIKTMPFAEFCALKNIEVTYDAVKSISKVVKNDMSHHIFNFEKIYPSVDFSKHRKILNENEFLGEECIFFDGNLLGNFYETIHTRKDTELKRLVARHIHYLPKIFDWGWNAVNKIGDKQYYAMHVRRNDFQYKDLFISAEKLCENIVDIIPEGATIYIATDQQDLTFFDKMSEKYKLVFYKDIENVLGSDIHYNYIPIIEQFICSRAIKFVGNSHSTLSSYVYRMRGYMNDIEHKDYYVNTELPKAENQLTFRETENYIANWAREFKDAWDFSTKRIFVSVASYYDRQLIDTLKDLYETADDINRITVGVHLQDDIEYYEELLKENFPNIKIIFTKKEESLGVVWARERIKNEQFTDEDYFLQVDAHSRFKFGWDSILINQISNIGEKGIISTYPNQFFLDEPDREYIKKLPTNAPLFIREFFTKESTTDNRLNTGNKVAMKDYELVDSHWVAAGFVFAPREWVHQIKLSPQILSKGEEESQLVLSYLQGWNIKLPSEAVVWHNYGVTAVDGSTYRRPNLNPRTDTSVEFLNDVLFNHTYIRTLEELESHLSITFRRP